MTEMNYSVDVDVPLHTAYDQWTQFESFPQFMRGIKRVEQVNDTETRWVTKIAGVKREFDAVISDQHPDEWITWKVKDGPAHSGSVIFNRVTDSTTQVSVQIEYEPGGLMEELGAQLGIVEQRLQTDLKDFKEYIESKGEDGAEGGWRGEVGPSGDVTTEPEQQPEEKSEEKPEEKPEEG